MQTTNDEAAQPLNFKWICEIQGGCNMKAQEFVKKYLVDRHNTWSSKWDGLQEKFGESDLLPLWIADMEFRTPEAVTDTLVKRARHGVFGYSIVPDSYYDAFIHWMQRRHNCHVEKEWIRFSTGCVTGIAWSIAAFTDPGDACMILTPVYYPFHNVVTNNKRTLVKVPMDYDGNGHCTMDYEAIEKTIVEKDVKLFVQCSPQNPMGRVWTEDELDKVLALCEKHHVLVVSDEIHQDLVTGDHPFISSLAVNGGKYRNNLVVLNSATKTFNLATLIHSHIIIPNPKLRKRYDDFASGMNRTEVSIMGMLAAEAAYRHGEEWLDGLLQVIRENYEYVKTTFARELPLLTVCDLEGTYLVMLDLRAYVRPEVTKDFVQGQCKLGVDYGEWFGDEYQGFIRWNLATDPALIKEAVSRIIKNIKD